MNTADATPRAAAPVVRQSGGGTEFGEVSLDIGSAPESAIGTVNDGASVKSGSADLEFGGIPQELTASAQTKAESGKVLATPSAVTSKARIGAALKAERRPAPPGVRYAVVGFFVALVLAWGVSFFDPRHGTFWIRVCLGPVAKVLNTSACCRIKSLRSNARCRATPILGQFEPC